MNNADAPNAAITRVIVTDQRRPDSPSPGLRAYLRFVVAVGGLVLLASIVSVIRTPYPLGWLALVLLTMGTGALRLNFAAVSANMAIDDTFVITTALLFGAGPATLAIAANSLLVSCRRRMPARQIAFNTAATAIAMWTSAQTFFIAAGVQPLMVATPPVATLVAPLL